MRIGRIGYINCAPVYGAIDRGIVKLPHGGELVTGTPAELNDLLVAGELDISVISAIEYARHATELVLLADLAISCDGPVRSVALFGKQPVQELSNRTVLLSASSRTSVALLELLCRDVWHIKPKFAEARAEAQDLETLAALPHEAVLVIGDAALKLAAAGRYGHRYDLGEEWKRWTGKPFVFAVWAARRSTDAAAVRRGHEALLASRAWGLEHLADLAGAASTSCNVPRETCFEYLSGLDYAFTDTHRAALNDFLRRVGVPQFMQVA
ncbi:MAG TPA: menaquinone biosynthesis protein [Gemmatimonadales bacterium]|jgi:chorismate dehydratase|nr:menaquinone biosynthesis protein [Gemmatimonadales bacterium]